MINNGFGTSANLIFPSRVKRVGAMSIDFFFALIFSFLFFGVACYPIFTNLPSVQENKRSYEEAGRELVRMADDTHLQRARDDSYTGLLSMEDTAKIYLTNLLKTSSYHNDIPYQEMRDGMKVTIEITSEDTFLKDDLSTDNLAYYFLGFKEANSIGNYVSDNKDYRHEKRLYLNSVILKLDSDNKDLVDPSFAMETDVFYLDGEKTTTLMNYLSFDDTNQEPKNLYDRLMRLYVASASFGIQDVEENFQAYKGTYGRFNDGYVSYSNGFMASSFLSYVFGGMISYVLFPLCFKKGKGLGYKILRMEVLMTSGDPFHWPMLLLKAFIQIIASFWSVLFIPLFLGQFPFVSTPLFASVSSLSLFLFSFLLMVLSLVFFFFNKNNQTLSDLASCSLVRSLETKKEETDGK